MWVAYHRVLPLYVIGYDVVVKITESPVDAKDRPLEPVVISNCGELIRKAPPKSASPGTCPPTPGNTLAHC